MRQLLTQGGSAQPVKKTVEKKNLYNVRILNRYYQYQTKSHLLRLQHSSREIFGECLVKYSLNGYGETSLPPTKSTGWCLSRRVKVSPLTKLITFECQCTTKKLLTTNSIVVDQKDI